MNKLRTLVFFLVVLAWAGDALAQTAIETYTYGTSAASAPYGSGLYIPAVPNSSASSLEHIPANSLLDLGSTQTATGAKTFNGAITLGSTFSCTNCVTAADLFGTIGSGGNVVLATGPTIASPTITGTVTGSGVLSVGNLATASQSTTVNGQTCTLASTCTITATATGITVGTTTISSGTNGSIEYNNAGTLGEKAVTGSGNIVEATSPTISSATLSNPVITGSLTATGLVTNSALAAGTFSNITGVGTLGSLAVSGNIVDNQSGSSAPSQSVSGLQVVGPVSTFAGVQANAFAQMGYFLGMRADGTPASPTAVTTGDNLAAFTGGGYNGSAYSTTNLAGVFVKATQPFTTSANGARLDFTTTANGATSPTDNMVIDQNGAVLLPASASNPGANGLAVNGPAVFGGSSTFTGAITASGLGSGTIANSICSTSAGALLSINAANCFNATGAVTSVTGTSGQVTASPTTGAVVVGLPSTLTPNETASGEWQFTGGAVVPPVSTPCGASITPTIGTQKIECTVSAATTLNVPSPFVAGETYSITLQEPSSSPFPISVAANITIPGGGIAALQQPTAGDRDKLVCETTVVGGTNSLDCGQLDQLRQPPVWHIGCHNSTGSTVSSISCTFTSPYTPPIGSVVLVGFDGASGTTTSLYGSASFSGGSCVVPGTNGFTYNANFGTGYYVISCQVTTAGATGITVNFSASVAGADIFADVVNNSFGIDTNNINTTATASLTPTSNPATTSNQDMVWGWMRCGSCGTVTAGTGFTLGQNVTGTAGGATEFAILPVGFPAATFGITVASGYGAAMVGVLP